MRRRTSVLIAVGTALAVGLAAGLLALPFAIVVDTAAMVAEGMPAAALCWGLYLTVSVLLWLTLWRIVHVAVARRPQR